MSGPRVVDVMLRRRSQACLSVAVLLRFRAPVCLCLLVRCICVLGCSATPVRLPSGVVMGSRSARCAGRRAWHASTER